MKPRLALNSGKFSNQILTSAHNLSEWMWKSCLDFSLQLWVINTSHCYLNICPNRWTSTLCVCVCAHILHTFPFLTWSCPLKITPILYDLICAQLLCVRKSLPAKESCIQALQNRLHPQQLLLLCVYQQARSQPSTQKPVWCFYSLCNASHRS